MPLSQPPGEAQFDFGEATVEIAGVRCKAALAVMTPALLGRLLRHGLPARVHRDLPAGHVDAFEFFGGVPTKIAYDNTTVAVKKVLVGPERELTREFLRAQEPLPLRPPVLSGGAGQREGPRREPRRLSDGATSSSRCRASRASPSSTRTCAAMPAPGTSTDACAGKPETKRRAPREDRAAMLRLPQDRLRVAHGSSSARANSLSLVRFDRNDYSVPTAYAHHELTVIGGVERSGSWPRDDLVATHARSWGREHRPSTNPFITWRCSSASPAPSTRRGPWSDWQLPACFWCCVVAWRPTMGTDGHQRVHQGAAAPGASPIARAAPVAVEAALDDRLRASADAVALILHHRAETPVALFSLDGHPHLEVRLLDPPDLASLYQRPSPAEHDHEAPRGRSPWCCFATT